ncbi:unnamed protein product [Bursaphelenchus okinawaensis]|uniref:Protein quiver n=1 Tax=Bursaphelenchus okinawaensis TaxID=465554 RepID=A0A811KC41_9BILA|nr:unnamed protein product [Bursaphelenchus okinawaensis]CAG9098227.1 unnamed protein product [Bursaphelenchus okinawaensis]
MRFLWTILAAFISDYRTVNGLDCYGCTNKVNRSSINQESCFRDSVRDSWCMYKCQSQYTVHTDYNTTLPELQGIQRYCQDSTTPKNGTIVSKTEGIAHLNQTTCICNQPFCNKAPGLFSSFLGTAFLILIWVIVY